MILKKAAISFVSFVLCVSLIPISALATEEEASLSYSENQESSQNFESDSSAEQSGEEFDTLSDSDAVDDNSGESNSTTEDTANSTSEGETESDTSATTSDKSRDVQNSVSIQRDGAAVHFDSISEAINDAKNNEVIDIAGTFVLSAPIEITGGKTITLHADGDVEFLRAKEYPQAGGKPKGLVKVLDKSSLNLAVDDAKDISFVLNGEVKDSDEAIVTVDGASSFTMGKGVVVERAKASWKPWGGVYVRNGSFVLDGGTIKDCFAMYNAAIAVEASASFEMKDGSITGNRSTYSETAIWSKGKVVVRGGSIEKNKANATAEKQALFIS